MSHDEVDLVVVQDHVRAEEICKALKHSGIHHVDFWPEHMRDVYGGKVVGLAYPKEDHLGPYHIRVREEDLPAARLVLATVGLGPAEQS